MVKQYSVSFGSSDLVYLLISHGADVNNAKTILHFAAKSGNLNLVNWLIENKADIHAKTNSGETILHFAAESGNLNLVSLLIHNGTDINTKTDDGLTSTTLVHKI
ncbi:ankyrin repeat protein [Rickettsia monacensis]|uniref:Ankyrin repeat protein n=2 Tax=Rickettsia monacensis TaxID=109232 RepID=A0A0B7J083_9RICK|nr:ankyrin repeat protein [Rickettsia monacensis]